MTNPLPLLLHADAENVSVPATEDAIGQWERTLGIPLPAGYRSFLLASDGYNGPVGRRGAYVDLWPVAVSLLGGYEGPEEAGVTLVGSNGGPTGFGIMRTDRGIFVSIPLASADSEEIRVLGLSFEQFLQSIANGEGW